MGRCIEGQTSGTTSVPLRVTRRRLGLAGCRLPVLALGIVWALCTVASVPARAGEQTNSPKPAIPSWARDARWYCDDAVWLLDSPVLRVEGDPQRLVPRMDRLERLGINALLLSYMPSGDDLVALCRLAHGRGIRVVPSALPKSESGAAAQRAIDLEGAVAWFDPNGDGDPSEGIDGVLCSSADFVALMDGLKRRDETLAKKVASRILWVAERRLSAACPDTDRTEPTANTRSGVAMCHDAGVAIRLFFAGLGEDYKLKKFVDDLVAFRGRYSLGAHVAMLSPLEGPARSRFPFDATFERSENAGKEPGSESDRDKLRLATVFHHFFLGAPLTYFGTEGGVLWPTGVATDGEKPTEGKDAAQEAGGDYYELLRLLNNRRDEHAALRHGDFRPVMLDEERKILAFARSLPGDEVIVVINYGPDKHRIKLPTSWPRQMVGLLSLQIRPTPHGGPAFRVAGARQESDQWGDVLFWMKPMSVRLMLVNDVEPR